MRARIKEPRKSMSGIPPPFDVVGTKSPHPELMHTSLHNRDGLLSNGRMQAKAALLKWALTLVARSGPAPPPRKVGGGDPFSTKEHQEGSNPPPATKLGDRANLAARQLRHHCRPRTPLLTTPVPASAPAASKAPGSAPVLTIPASPLPCTPALMWQSDPSCLYPCQTKLNPAPRLPENARLAAGRHLALWPAARRRASRPLSPQRTMARGRRQRACPS